MVVLFTDFTEFEAWEMAIPHNIVQRNTYELNLQCALYFPESLRSSRELYLKFVITSA